MKIKPKVKRDPQSNDWIAYYEHKNKKIYAAYGSSPSDAINRWYSEFKKELKIGGG